MLSLSVIWYIIVINDLTSFINDLIKEWSGVVAALNIRICLFDPMTNDLILSAQTQPRQNAISVIWYSRHSGLISTNKSSSHHFRTD